MSQTAKGGQHHGEGKLNEHGPQRPAENDHGRGGLKNLAQVAAFQQQARQDASDCDHNPAECGLVHGIYLAGSDLPASSAGGDNATRLSHPGKMPLRTDLRNSRMRSRICATFSRTTIFSPVTSVITVSGACSTNLMRSELSTRGWLLSRVS